jgi:plastocyanin
MDKILGSDLGIVLMLIALLAIFAMAVPMNTYALVKTVSTGESDIGSTPVVSVITISKGPQGITIFNPETTTIKTGEEILILNNDTMAHTVRSGAGPDDPLAGKLFSVGPIQPRGFIEYVASNLQPGTYSFYSASDPSVKGELVVTK